MFKVGDKGKTKGGYDYEIIYFNPAGGIRSQGSFIVNTSEAQELVYYADGHAPGLDNNHDLLPSVRADTTERDELAKKFLIDMSCQFDGDESWQEHIERRASSAFDYADAYMTEKERRKS